MPTRKTNSKMGKTPRDKHKAKKREDSLKSKIKKGLADTAKNVKKGYKAYRKLNTEGYDIPKSGNKIIDSVTKGHKVVGGIGNDPKIINKKTGKESKVRSKLAKVAKKGYKTYKKIKRASKSKPAKYVKSRSSMPAKVMKSLAKGDAKGVFNAVTYKK